MAKIKTIQSVYEITSKVVKYTKGKQKLTEDVSIRVYLHDGFIEIVDEDMDKKAFVFAGKDSPEKRAYWIGILKTLETALKMTPLEGKE